MRQTNASGWLLRCVMGAALACISCGTGGVAPPPPSDAGPRPDRGRVVDVGDPSVDTDRDGLCDGTELMRGTDPRAVDTDGDGLIDSFEVRIGSDPRTLRDPSANDRVSIREEPDSFTTLEHFLDYRGSGEVLSAAMQDRAAGVDGVVSTAVADYAVEAIAANPAAFVRDIVGARFIGVQGRAVLQWRVTITSRWSRAHDVDGGAAPATLGCRRSYEAVLVVKREGDLPVQSRRVLVDVVPTGARDGGAGAWPAVSADGYCLPARCF